MPSVLHGDCEVSSIRLDFHPARARWSGALLASVAAHFVALLFLCWPAKPAFVKPTLLARGEGGTSAPAAVALYLPQNYRAQMEQQPALALPALRRAKSNKTSPRKRHNVLEQETAHSTEIGSPLGSAVDGAAYGDEIKPALPITFRDPQFAPWEAPSGVQGDVVVEITIDVQGNVTETRLLHGVGHGVDEKVIAAAREWHFRPATRNGVAVPSRQDYRFHFPS